MGHGGIIAVGSGLSALLWTLDPPERRPLQNLIPLR
jgi:hypothetical protein